MSTSQLPRWTWALLPPAALAVGGGVWLLRTFNPNAVDSPFPPCAFHAVTGWYCVGCGITRCLHALAHFDLAGAWAMNPLVVVMLGMAPLVGGWALGWRPRALRPFIGLLQKPAFWLTLLPVYWVARNLPWAPFAWLAPGAAP